MDEEGEDYILSNVYSDDALHTIFEQSDKNLADMVRSAQ